MNTVIFACVHNAGRSQMAAAWFNALADSTKVQAISAGTEPGARVHPEVLEAMREAEHFAGFIVAEEAGEIVGAAGLEVHGVYGLLRSVVVSRSATKRGIGRQLTDRILQLAEGRGLRSVYLLTTTAADYFARLAFERVGREQVPVELHGSRELQGACPASAIVMVRVSR